MGDSFVLFDVSMEMDRGKFTLGNGSHTQFMSFPEVKSLFTMVKGRCVSATYVPLLHLGKTFGLAWVSLS